MPELPEVETLRRELFAAVKGRIIKSVVVNWPKMVKPLSETQFASELKNKKIIGVARRAKILIIGLNNGNFLLIHLKLTGQLIFIPSELKAKSSKRVFGGHPQPGGLDNLPNKFTHIIISFTDGSILFFNDQRKFGWMKVVGQPALEKITGAYGIEPLKPEFTAKKMAEIIQRYPNRKIKQLLLDQTLVAGIGNIYADESCFYARILPMRIAKTLTGTDIKNLRASIIKVLKLSIAKKGTSADSYVQLDGRPGGMVPYLKVYNKRGKRCSRCGGTIEKIKLNGRGTHFCRGCQK